LDLLHAQNLAACVRNYDLSAPGEPSQANLGPASALRDAVYDLFVSEAATESLIAAFVRDIDEASKLIPSRKGSVHSAAILSKQKIQLARILGISPARELRLAEKLPTDSTAPQSVDDTIGLALNHRADLKAPGLQVKAAEEVYRATKSECLPSFAIKGLYGVQGINPDKGPGVFQALATLTVSNASHVAQPDREEKANERN